MAAPRAPQDRQAPKTRTVQRKPTAAELAAADAADRIEAETEALDTEEWITVPLPTGEDIRVLPFLRWPRTTYRAIVRGGDFEAVADVIHDEDRDTFEDWESDIGALIGWVTDLISASGQDLGEYGASNRSSRRMRRR